MKAVGIILAGGSNNRMGELSKKRAIPAMPVGGSFRCIDFALSNMSNSHVQTVAVLTQYNARSLNEHLSSSKWWDFGRKQGGMYLFNYSDTANLKIITYIFLYGYLRYHEVLLKRYPLNTKQKEIKK